MQKQPRFLKEGDTVVLASTGNPITKKAVAPAEKILQGWGLKTELSKTIGARKASFAGSDEFRLREYQELLDNENIGAILHAHGGDGAVRIMDDLDYSALKKHPKWIAGYSDVTFLHSHIHAHLGMETIHSTMPIDIASQGVLKDSWETLRSAMFGEKLQCEFTSHKMNRTGEAEGILTGGNLSILSSLQGTNSDISTDGKILFIECIGEHYFRIDTFMLCLKKSGKFEKLKGLIVGRFTSPERDRPDFGYTTKEIVMNAVKDYDFPVCFNYPAGHQFSHCALVLGRKAKVRVLKSEVCIEQLKREN